MYLMWLDISRLGSVSSGVQLQVFDPPPDVGSFISP